jgi:lipoate-protein ligase A
LAGGVLESYNRLSRALLFAVRELGLQVEVKEEASHAGSRYMPPSAALPDQRNMTNPVCFEVPSTYEITVNGKKLIGSAQARKREGVLQHGSLPLTGDLTRICDALVFQDESARAKAKERLLARATTVESVIGVETVWETAAQAFVRGFEAELGIQFERGEVPPLFGGKMSPSEIQRTEELVKEKYAHASWTERI